jgi:hypothetical protein
MRVGTGVFFASILNLHIDVRNSAAIHKEHYPVVVSSVLTRVDLVEELQEIQSIFRRGKIDRTGPPHHRQQARAGAAASPSEAVPRLDRDGGDVLGLGEIRREWRSSTAPCWCFPCGI